MARSKALRLLGVIAFAVVYVVIAYFYNDSAQGAQLSANVSPAANEVSVTLEPDQLDAAVDDKLHTLELDVRVGPGWDFYEAGNATVQRSLAIEIVTDAFQQTKIFPAGSPIDPFRLTVDLDGNVQNYPFDSYRTTILVTAAEVDLSGKAVREVPVVGGVNTPQGLIGWRIETHGTEVSAEQSPLSSSVLTGTGAEGLLVALEISRAHSTVMMAALLLSLMVILAIGSVALARVARQAHREVNPTYAGVVAALLFALIPIREFLPGAPPLGSWIDILVFFWVEIVLMLALISIIHTSVRRVNHRAAALDTR